MKAPAPTKADTAAVIPTYNPDAQFPERLNRIAAEVNWIIVVDNHSGAEKKAMLQRLEHDTRIAVLLENTSNEGVGTALNQGIEAGRQRSIAWFMLLDQDSEPHEGLLNFLSSIYTRVHRQHHRLLVGINHRDAHTHALYVPYGDTGEDWTEKQTVITSGTLLSYEAYLEIGPFREDFFIDGIDHDYCLRARRKGYKVLLGLRPLLSHPMGDRKLHSLPFLRTLSLTSTNYPPFRWYFMTRNRLTLVREYLLQEPTWTVSRLIRLFGSMIIAIIIEQNRLEKIAFAMKGMRDFLKKDFDAYRPDAR